MVKVNGTSFGQSVQGEYVALHRNWKANDLVEISFDMEWQLIHANPAVPMTLAGSPCSVILSYRPALLGRVFSPIHLGSIEEKSPLAHSTALIRSGESQVIHR